MTGICLDQAIVKCFTDSWGCVVEPMPPSYLRLPSCIGLHRIQLWSLVIDKVEWHLASWKGRVLSPGCRVTLIKAIISSISLFFMSVFFMVVVVTLEKLMRALRLLIEGASEDSQAPST
ncbi:hypothetical protein AMTRI_Chr11g93110 [Amborella trichopoda]